MINHLGQEKAAGRSGRLAEILLRYDVIVIDQRGYLPILPIRRPIAVPCDQETLGKHVAAHHH
jgi:hypothetical protein